MANQAIDPDDLRHMRAALALAARGLGNTWPNPAVGCVIVRDGLVVGRGWTQPGGRPHAETEALARAGGAARGATAYVTLEPCAMCAGAIVAARLDKVRYGADDPAAGCCGSVYRITEDPAFTHYAQADGGLLAEKCQALLTEFFAAHRKGENHVKPCGSH